MEEYLTSPYLAVVAAAYGLAVAMTLSLTACVCVLVKWSAEVDKMLWMWIEYEKKYKKLSIFVKSFIYAKNVFLIRYNNYDNICHIFIQKKFQNFFMFIHTYVCINEGRRRNGMRICTYVIKKSDGW